MYIESLHIASFGSLHDFRLALGDGLNILEGRNESGKSTVAEFIRFVFYGFSGKADRERHISFSSGAAEGSLIVNCEEKRYRVERRISGAREIFGVFDLDDGSKCFEGKVPGEIFFGIPENLFASTMFIGQTDGGRINGKETSEAVDNLLFSADESISVKKTLKKLDAARTELLYKNKKGGRIYEIENELSELRGKLCASSEANAEIISLEGSIEALKKKLVHDEEYLASMNTSLSDFEKLEIRKRNQRLSSLEKSWKEVLLETDSFKKKYTRNGFFPDAEYLDRLKECGEEISRSDRRVKEIETSLEELNEEIRMHETDREKTVERENAERSRLLAKRGMALALGILFCVLFIPSVSATAIFFMTAKKAIGTAVAILTALFLGGMAASFVFVSRYSAAIREHDSRTANKEDLYHLRLERIRQDLEAAKAERTKYKTMLDDLCGKWGAAPSMKTLTELKTVLEEDKRLSEEAEKRRFAYVNLKSEAEARSAYEAEDDGAPITLPDGFDPKEVKKRCSFLSATLRINSEKLKKDEIRLAQLTASAVSPALLQEKITALEYEQQELTGKYNAYLLAYEKLETAGEKLRAAISPRLSEMAGDFMGAVTGGKYQELGVDSGFSMTFRPDSGNGGRITKGEEFMSAGTADAAYVSLRLALVSLICGDKLPPVIFDESFARLDDGRLENMLKILASSGSQILLLTSLNREAALLAQNSRIPFHAVKLG